jgi:hypothetical protein
MSHGSSETWLVGARHLSKSSRFKHPPLIGDPPWLLGRSDREPVWRLCSIDCAVKGGSEVLAWMVSYYSTIKNVQAVRTYMLQYMHAHTHTYTHIHTNFYFPCNSRQYVRFPRYQDLQPPVSRLRGPNWMFGISKATGLPDTEQSRCHYYGGVSYKDVGRSFVSFRLCCRCRLQFPAFTGSGGETQLRL